jgi:hypothetical protein
LTGFFFAEEPSLASAGSVAYELEKPLECVKYGEEGVWLRLGEKSHVLPQDLAANENRQLTRIWNGITIVFN